MGKIETMKLCRIYKESHGDIEVKAFFPQDLTDPAREIQIEIAHALHKNQRVWIRVGRQEYHFTEPPPRSKIRAILGLVP